MKYLVFTLIFFVQANVWAARPYSIKAMVDLRPVEDQRYFEETLGDVGKLNLPELTFNNDQVSFTIRGKRFTGKAVDEYKLMLQGKELDFGPGKLFKAHEELEKIWREKNFTYTSFLIPEAHAVGELLVVGGVVAAIALSLTHSHYVAQTLNRHCEELQLSDSLTSQDVKSAKTDLGKTRLCNAGKDQWPVIVKACEEMRSCIMDLEEKLGHFSGAINNSGRGLIKDVKEIQRAPSSSLKKASNQ
ncbi:hypothetical protein [Peredibacter starrii]|uniref:Uncharacterized protein n=1 Tax=Peredibacter starrii TaxID=28202 RepID=A0AAX4HV63_9BACT|nr:hypothetical protein [Peredibacter starrii]WPU66871.1 hypothetical protein SOO65_08925 [Peredibacter starrii]